MSRNHLLMDRISNNSVTPRERRVSRNSEEVRDGQVKVVTPRERRVSRNIGRAPMVSMMGSHASREACE